MAPSSDRPHARGFAVDAETERALREGLAEREARVQRGRLTAALRTLVAEPSPALVFVDFDGVPEPEAAAKDLAAVCALGTVLIAVGSADTAQVTRSLLQHGIADYLVKPISAAEVREAYAKALEELPERTHAGRVVGVAGSAGSGASTMIAGLARGVAAGGRSATVVDLDPLAGKLAALLETEPRGDVAELLAAPEYAAEAGDGEPGAGDELPELVPSIDSDRIERVVAAAGTGVSLVGYSHSGPPAPAPSPEAASALLDRLANRSHVVLVSGVADPETRTAVLERADARVLLYEPTLSSISVAVHCLASLGTECPSLLVECHPRLPKSTLSRAQIRYALAGRRPDVVVPFDPALHAAATGEGRVRSPGKAYRKALHEVAARVIEGPAVAADR